MIKTLRWTFNELITGREICLTGNSFFWASELWAVKLSRSVHKSLIFHGMDIAING